MKAFITGATGFIGANLCEALSRKEWDIRVLLHKKGLDEKHKYEEIWGDICDYSLLKNALKDIDILFHLASALGASLIPKKEFYRINAEGTETILRACREAGVKRIIHFSSAGVLGAVPKNIVADENFPPTPLSIYDKSKCEGERAALHHASQGLNVLVVRPGWVYGPGDSRTFKLIKAIAHRRFFLVSRGKAWQTPVYIDDLIQSISLCAEKGKKGEIYHLAGSEVLTVREITETIAAAAGVKTPFLSLPLFPTKGAAWFLEKAFRLFGKEAPLTPGKLAFFIHPKPLSIEKAIQELGYKPKIPFKEGTAHTLSWYRKHGWL